MAQNTILIKKVVTEFSELFSGYAEAYGSFPITGENQKGKKEGRPRTIKKKLTYQDYYQHLMCSRPIGIVPLDANNQLKFAAIDIDVYDLEFLALEQRIKEHKLPLVICRSKSGGAHCYIFFSQPIDAAPVIARLKEWAKLLGFEGTEVFPKQSTRNDGEIGNWINLPYFEQEKTERYAFVGGKPLNFIEFLSHAQSEALVPDKITQLFDSAIQTPVPVS